MSGTVQASHVSGAFDRATVEVDLGAVTENLATVRSRVGEAQVMAVVKADAYGHGAIEVSRALEAAGVDWLGVAIVEEGIALREAGIRTPILVLGPARVEDARRFERHSLTPTLSSHEEVERWTGGDHHLKVDTGMGRLGLTPEEARAVLAGTVGDGGGAVCGLLSHLADAEDPESDRNALQLAAFQALVDGLGPARRAGILVHLANSAGAMHLPGSRHDLVRCGLAIYGLDPARREDGLRPALRLESRIVQIRDLRAGDRPGYGGRWTAPADGRLAVVPIGYADGYPWRAGRTDGEREGAEALVGGKRVRVVGAVSMDMLFLDISQVDAGTGDRVTLLGRDGSEEITAWDLAAAAGTIPYEILCELGPRLPRRYRR